MNNTTLISEILKISISYQKDTWSEINYEYTIETILNLIKNEELKTQIEDLRLQLSKGNKEYYDNNKKKLPAVTFSGSFTKKRNLENLKKYNSLIIIDIDKLDSQTILKVEEKLSQDKFVLSYWRSPSNNGYKGIVPLKFNIEEITDFDFIHKCAFRKLSQYFLDNHEIELDKSGSDITRLCFLSSDKDLIIKKQISYFEISENEILSIIKNKKNYKQIIKFSSKRNALYNPANKNNPRDRMFMSNIIRYLYRKNKSITFDYQNWSKVAMAISNTFTFDIGLKYFIKISKIDKDKFNEITCINFLTNCYETRKGEITFSTIIYLANLQGYQTKYQKNGVPKAEE